MGIDAISRSAVQKIMKLVDNLPSLPDNDTDKIEVVYCKDCFYSRKLKGAERLVFNPDCLVCKNCYGIGVQHKEYKLNGGIVCPKEYCSRGIRRREMECEENEP